MDARSASIAILGMQLVLSAGCSPRSGEESEPIGADNEFRATSSATTATDEATTYRTVTFSLPEEVRWDDTALLASDTLTVYSQAVVNSGAVNLGTELLSIEPNARVQALTSFGDVRVGSGATVSGQIRSAGVVQLEPNANVLEPVQSGVSPGPLASFEWVTQVPLASTGALSVAPGQSATLVEGSYSQVTLGPGAILHMREGIYHVDSLNMEPGSQIVVENSGDRTILAIDETLRLQPTLSVANPETFALIYGGTEPLIYRGPALGLVYAPEAFIQLEPWQHHRGQFVAKSIAVGPGAIVDAIALDLSVIFRPQDPPALPPEAVVNLSYELQDTTLDQRASNMNFGTEAELIVHGPGSEGDSSVHIAIGPDMDRLREDLVGRRVYSATIRLHPLPGSGSSMIPVEALPLVQDWGEGSATWNCPADDGCAADGAWDLTAPFDDDSPLAATVAPIRARPQGGGGPPTLVLDVTRDLQFWNASDAEFEGWLLSTMPEGGAFASSEHPDVALRPELTIVASETPCDGCEAILWPPPEALDNILEDPVPPEETQALLSTFSWESTESVPALNPVGDPSLRYALIYIEDDSQIETLAQYGIEWDSLPYFPQEYEKWEDQSGVFAFEGNVDGVFVFAFIPGEIYNAIREENIADPEGADFRAIVLRDTPPEFALADGSISYEALAAEGFEYGLNADGVIEDTQDLRGLIRRARERLRELARRIIDAVRQGIERIAGDVLGEARLTLNMGVADVDPVFRARKMVQTWGINGGSTIPLKNIEVRVRQGQVGIGLRKARTDENGVASLTVTRNRELAMCIDLDSPAVKVTHSFLPARICSFGLQIDRINGDSRLNVDVYHHDVYALAQFQDSQDYAREVMELDVPKTTILSGGFGSILARSGPFTPCFGVLQGGIARAILPIPEGIEGTAVEDFIRLLAGGGVVDGGLLFGTRLPDVVMSSTAEQSRGIPTHEYGHVVQCAGMLAEDGADPEDAALLWAALSAAALSSDRLERTAVILAEGIAEWFGSQVSGGVGYFSYTPRFESLVGSLAPFYFCNTSILDSPLSCLEFNFAASSSNPQRTSRWASLLHDIFDGDGAQSGTSNRPTSGMYWSKSDDVPPHFDPRLNDAEDEEIRADGELYTRIWAEYFSLAGRWGRDEDYWSEGRLSESIFNVLRDDGYSTSQICHLFEIHDESGRCLNGHIELRVPLEVLDTTPPDVTLNPLDWRNIAVLPPGSAPVIHYNLTTQDGQFAGEGECDYNIEDSCSILVPEGGSVEFDVDDDAPTYYGFSFGQWGGLCHGQSDCLIPIVVGPAEIGLIYEWSMTDSQYTPVG